MKYEFPKDFKWGSAVWAQGTEGAFDKDGKAPTVWDEYYRLEPERFYNKVGSSETLNWYENYEKYIQLAKDIGHNSFRTSIMWARLIPDGKNVNEKAVEFYRNMFQSFKDKNIELSIVLYWFDMPLLFEKQGGFTNREVIDSFVYYCQKCFELFDGLVDIWYVYNEPFCDVCFKYQWLNCYPNILDFDKAIHATYHMILAHAKVVEVFKNNNFNGKIGSVLNRSKVYPRSQHPEDIKAAKNYELLYFTCFDDGLLLGEINKDWLALIQKCGVHLDIKENDLEIIQQNSIDVLGLNIYYPERIKCLDYQINPQAPITLESFASAYEMPGRQFNKDRGWEIYPQVMYDTLMYIKERYNNPEIRITENGIGIQDEYRYRNNAGQIQDDYRIDYVKQHLIYAFKAIEDGVRLVGYNMWSFIDLWSPTNQFKNCYGFYEFDLKSHETKRKKSADWFEKVSKDNGFEE